MIASVKCIWYQFTLCLWIFCNENQNLQQQTFARKNVFHKNFPGPENNKDHPLPTRPQSSDKVVRRTHLRNSQVWALSGTYQSQLLYISMWHKCKKTKELQGIVLRTLYCFREVCCNENQTNSISPKGPVYLNLNITSAATASRNNPLCTSHQKQTWGWGKAKRLIQLALVGVRRRESASHIFARSICQKTVETWNSSQELLTEAKTSSKNFLWTVMKGRVFTLGDFVGRLSQCDNNLLVLVARSRGCREAFLQVGHPLSRSLQPAGQFLDLFCKAKSNAFWHKFVISCQLELNHKTATLCSDHPFGTKGLEGRSVMQ